MFGRDHRLVRREDDGTISARLSEPEQLLVKSLLAQLRTLLRVEGEGDVSGDSGLRRLFPTAYPDDEALEAEYQGLVRDDLLARRLEAIAAVEETVVLPTLDDEQLAQWLQVVNDLRLVLGTRLDVSEDDLGPIDPEDPDAPALVAYGYLGELLDDVVAALAAALPDDPEA